MAYFEDLTDRKFGRLTVVSLAPKSKTGRTRWHCICDCGNKTIVQANNLKSGEVKSCNCMKEVCHFIHGHTPASKSQTSEYTAWINIQSRCHNEKDEYYKDYGGRGIKVCDRWRFGENGKPGFLCFLEDMGLKPDKKLSLDRVNGNGDYKKENCRWATAAQQARNKRNNVHITYNGETHILKDWAPIVGIPYNVLWKRYHRKWSTEKMLTFPHRPTHLTMPGLN